MEDEQSRVAVGLDLGRSATKIAATVPDAEPFHSVIPAAVIEAYRLTDPQSALKAREDTVTCAGRSFFTGSTAVLHGACAHVGGHSKWVLEEMHEILLLDAWSRLLRNNINLNRLLILGLPHLTFINQSLKLKALVSNRIDVNERSIKVVPQAYAAYAMHAIDKRGVPLNRGAILKQYIAVIDIGYFTTDFVLMKNQISIELPVSVAPGIYRAVELLSKVINKNHNIFLNPLEAEDCLRKKSMTYQGAVVDLSTEVSDVVHSYCFILENEIKRILGNCLDSLDSLVIAGGGALIVSENICSIWRHATVIESPRMAVAEGMRRLGQYWLSNR